MVILTFDLRTWEAEAGVSLSFKISLVDIVSSRTARPAQKDSSQINKRKEEEEEEEEEEEDEDLFLQP
jgi:ribosomal protein L12E/L44/L45/RPP1/RPP2